MTTNAFLFFWCEEGIESIIPITEFENFEEKQVFEIIKTGKVTKSPFNEIINVLTLRARFNPQRHYEIYALDCTPEITKEDWENYWHDSPQAAADLIRSKGVCISSYRRDSTDRIVIR